MLHLLYLFVKNSNKSFVLAQAKVYLSLYRKLWSVHKSYTKNSWNIFRSYYRGYTQENTVAESFSIASLYCLTSSASKADLWTDKLFISVSYPMGLNAFRYIQPRKLVERWHLVELRSLWRHPLPRGTAKKYHWWYFLKGMSSELTKIKQVPLWKLCDEWFLKFVRLMKQIVKRWQDVNSRQLQTCCLLY